jgi:hypothetical protein
MMVAANPEVSHAAFDAVPGEKELVKMDGGHFRLLYHPSEPFDRASKTQADFLIRTVRPTDTA